MRSLPIPLPAGRPESVGLSLVRSNGNANGRNRRVSASPSSGTGNGSGEGSSPESASSPPTTGNGEEDSQSQEKQKESNGACSSDKVDPLAAYGGRARVIHREKSAENSTDTGSGVNDSGKDDMFGKFVRPVNGGVACSGSAANSNSNGTTDEKDTGGATKKFKSSLWFDANFENRDAKKGLEFSSFVASPTSTSNTRERGMSLFSPSSANTAGSGSGTTQTTPFIQYMQGSINAAASSSTPSSVTAVNGAQAPTAFTNPNPNMNLNGNGSGDDTIMMDDSYSWLGGFGMVPQFPVVSAQTVPMLFGGNSNPDPISNGNLPPSATVNNNSYSTNANGNADGSGNPYGYLNSNGLGMSVGLSAMGMAPSFGTMGSAMGMGYDMSGGMNAFGATTVNGNGYGVHSGELFGDLSSGAGSSNPNSDNKGGDTSKTQAEHEKLPPGMFGYGHLISNGYRSASASGSGPGSGTNSTQFSQLYPTVSASTPSPPNPNPSLPLPQNSWFFSNFSNSGSGSGSGDSPSTSPHTQMASSFDMGMGMGEMNVDLPLHGNGNTLGASGLSGLVNGGGGKISEPALNDATWQEYMRQVFVSGGHGGGGGESGNDGMLF